MSGICGICHPGVEVLPGSIEAMLARLALPQDNRSRGGTTHSVAFGVAQKWTFQQMATVGGVQIAVDADLLNLEELSKRLKQKEIDASDLTLAEQLAWLYTLEGAGFIERLQGAFSLALWDERKQRLIMAIDPVGIKSLYWSQEGDRLLFSTRAGAIRACQGISGRVNPAAVVQYLLFSVVPAPSTIYVGVEKLRPGHILIFEKARVQQRRYWDLEYPESGDHNVRRWAAELREGMRTAVSSHLEGCEVENTGAYLSGGTDSSSVTAFMSERFAPVHTFSIFFPEATHNEIGFARTTAEAFKTRHHEKCLFPEDAREVIPKIIEYYDEPFANSSAIGAYFCAQLAKENGMETLLAGDGGDELFAGNSRYASDKYFALYSRVPRWVRRSILEPITRVLPANDGWLSLPRRYVRRAQIPNPRRIFSYGLFLTLDPEELFETDFLRQVPPEEWMGVAEGHFHAAQASNELNRLMYLDLKIILADNDLRKVSGTAELAGIRVRYPLLDTHLAELSGRIPSSLKLKGFEKRYIFKQAMKGILPHQVLYKKKHGFGVPLARWFLQDSHLSSLLQDVLNDPRTRQRGYFRPQFIDRLAGLHRSDDVGFYGEVVWYLLALELWHRQHLDGHPWGPCAD
jgi:asparagine synthase (glutamine-hydrolysing)